MSRPCSNFNLPKHLFAGFICLFVAVLFSGCAGYKLGPTNGETAGSRSIQINPVQNETFSPRLGESVASSLRKRLQQDGTYQLNTQNEGDIIVTAVLKTYDREELSFQPNDVRTVRDYYINVSADVKAVERSSGKIILNRAVKGRTSIRVGTDMTSAERQAIPLLADDLAKNITALLVDGTW